MARRSKVEKERKRAELVERHAGRRRELKAVMSSPKSSDEERQAAQRELRSLPRDSSPTRVRNRCALTGRPRAYLRQFGLSRVTFREMALDGKLPGVRKASW